MKNVVIVGGGTGGTIVANILARKLSRKEVNITLVNDSSQHVYQPSFIYVALGYHLSKESIMREERDLLDKNVNLIIKKAVKIDVANRCVTLEDGEKLDYDYLVVATGSRIVPEEIPGYHAAYHFYNLDGAMKLGQVLEDFRKGVITVGIGGIPYKCPPALLSSVAS